MDALITAKNLNHHYGSFHALQDVSLELQRGEVLGLLGPNGAGKSTSMRIISGNMHPTSGSIYLNGINLLERPLEAKASLGYLPEQPPLYRDMTILEYLEFCARLRKIPKQQQNHAVLEAMELTGLAEAGKRLIANLSKGYQQRVGIAQAIVHKPQIIILDEPTSGLDPNQILEIRSLISELGKEYGVILSTHILPEVQSVCSRVVVLNQGQIVFSDSISNMDTSPPSGVLLRLERTPEPEQLSTIPGVLAWEQHMDGRLHATLDTNASLPSISQQLIENGWGLVEFTPERHSLEQVFTRLTTNEDSPTC